MYKVCIVGCGSIGALKPDHVDYPGSANILTHANAVDRHPQTEIVSFVDIDSAKASEACKKWNVSKIYPDIDRAMKDNPDIIIVATPTENHFETLNIVLDYNPGTIIAEKPFCESLSEAVEIACLQKEKCKDGRRQIPIAINYPRRFTPGIQEVKKNFDEGKYGKSLNCRVLYTRGLRHEGCHAIDLMNWFFGYSVDIKGWQYSHIEDRIKNDPSYTVIYRSEECPSVVFQPCDGRLYGIFEVDICFEKCRIRFIDNGLYYETYPITQENEWGHKSLDYSLVSVIRKETHLNTALYNLIDNVVNYLDGKEDLLCTIEDAIKVHHVLGE